MNANGLSDSVRQDLVKRFLLINLDYPVKASANFPNFWVQILHKEATFCSPNCNQFQICNLTELLLTWWATWKPENSIWSFKCWTFSHASKPEPGQTELLGWKELDHSKFINLADLLKELAYLEWSQAFLVSKTGLFSSNWSRRIAILLEVSWMLMNAHEGLRKFQDSL